MRGMATSEGGRPRPTVRERLQQAAFELFDEQGYDGTTVDAIAERAGVGRTTFFRAFRSKEEVIFPHHDDLLEQVRGRLDAASERHSLVAVFEASRLVLRHYLNEGELAAASTGQVFSGRQGIPMKLVDRVGNERDAVAWLEQTKGVRKDLPIRDWKPSSDRDLSIFAMSAKVGCGCPVSATISGVTRCDASTGTCPTASVTSGPRTFCGRCRTGVGGSLNCGAACRV